MNFNKFLEKQFYIINDQNISINYNIGSKSSNQSFGLLFDFNGFISIKGYFYNISENKNNFDDYVLNNNDKYFICSKNNQFDFFNLDINVYSEIVSQLIIYDIK